MIITFHKASDNKLKLDCVKLDSAENISML